VPFSVDSGALWSCLVAFFYDVIPWNCWYLYDATLPTIFSFYFNLNLNSDSF
jgi:hypothetical protein